MNEKKFAVVIDERAGPMVKEVSSQEIDAFTHDIVEGWFEAIPIQNPIHPWKPQLIMLVNEDGIRLNLSINPYATIISRPLSGDCFILGKAVLFDKDGADLVPFTEDMANQLVKAIKPI